MSEVVLRARGLTRTFTEGPAPVSVLAGIDFELRRGERVAIVGRSGAGKSTLLHVLGGLDVPTAGEVEVAGRALGTLGEAARGRLRNRHLGFIYQFHHLLPEFSAVENVALPVVIGGASPQQARARARELLGRVGLAARMEHKPGEMSGGERQRTAVARALANGPDCILADEPTGNLDRASAQQVLDVMFELNTAAGAALVVVTHDPAIAARMDRTFELADGRLRPVETAAAG